MTNNSFTIHHFDGSWQCDEKKYSKKLKEIFNKYLPPKISNCLANFISELRFNGIKSALVKSYEWIRKNINFKNKVV